MSALKAVAKATSSGFLPIRAAIISTIAGKLHGSFRWNVQYLWHTREGNENQCTCELNVITDSKIHVRQQTHRCKNSWERSVIPLLTCCGNLEARVFGYMNGASLSTKTRSSGNSPLSSNFRTPVSDLSYRKYTSIIIKYNMNYMLHTVQCTLYTGRVEYSSPYKDNR